MSAADTPFRPRRLDIAYDLFEEFADWWENTSWPARIPAAAALAAAVGLVLVTLHAVLSLLGWLGNGATRLVGHNGAHALAAWQISHVITDPVRHYVQAGAAALPVSGSTLAVFWLVAAGALWPASLVGVRGARIGWAVYGAATVAMVYAGTAPTGRGVAAGVAAAAWALLSIPAYWTSRPGTTNKITILNPTRDTTSATTSTEPIRPAGELTSPRYRKQRDEIVATWRRRSLVGPHGALPGAALVDLVVVSGGWVATVQIARGRQSWSDVCDAADRIAATFKLPPGSVLAEAGLSPDLATVTAFPSPAGADYQKRCPLIPLTAGREFASETSPSGQLSHLNAAELADWAGKYADSWQRMRGGDRVDVERYWRRLTRLRGGILDALPLAAPGEVPEILTEHGLAFDALPEDLAAAAGLHRRR